MSDSPHTSEWLLQDAQLAQHPPAHLRRENIDQNLGKRPFPPNYLELDALTARQLRLVLRQLGVKVEPTKPLYELQALARFFRVEVEQEYLDRLEAQEDPT